MVLSSLVRRDDRSFVVHLLEPAINRCLYGDFLFSNDEAGEKYGDASQQ